MLRPSRIVGTVEAHHPAVSSSLQNNKADGEREGGVGGGDRVVTYATDSITSVTIKPAWPRMYPIRRKRTTLKMESTHGTKTPKKVVRVPPPDFRTNPRSLS